ncbi:hypothetical protein [Psychroserpens damuponensis]|uniref:hypothetical protein n=1 Tax=Psychroserpens damuponensis TaxID=943936 RepID=UPI00058FC0B3|nr:hypothetical protein [Psychroserpens damuponensis]
MKYILFLWCLYSSFSFSQSKNNSVNPRFEFHTLNSKQFNDTALSYTISNKDTFYLEKQKFLDLSTFQYDKEKTPKLIERYKTSVFFNSQKRSKRTYRLLQWKVPVVIYFDKEIPNRIKKEVKTFYKQIENVDNLSVSFTNNINKANYRIKITSDTFNTNSINYDNLEKYQKFTHFFDFCSYSVIKDNSDGVIGCTLKINREQLKTDDYLLSNIKQGIFLSLGRFFMNPKLIDESLLTNTIYVNNPVLSDLDVSLLKLHYYQLYNRRIDGTDFENLFHTN